MGIPFPDPVAQNDERTSQYVRCYILEDAFKRDELANRVFYDPNMRDNYLGLKDIQGNHQAYTLELIRSEAKGMSNTDQPLIEFVGSISNDIIRITDRGRNIYEEERTKDMQEWNLG